MTTTNFAERVGLEEQTLEHLKANRAELEARGLNVAYWITRLEAAIATVKAANERQESLKAELKACTATVNASDREAYVLASSVIDGTIGIWGKDSEKAVVLARSRSKIHRPPAHDDETATPLPVPQPPQ